MAKIEHVYDRVRFSAQTLQTIASQFDLLAVPLFNELMTNYEPLPGQPEPPEPAKALITFSNMQVRVNGRSKTYDSKETFLQAISTPYEFAKCDLSVPVPASSVTVMSMEGESHVWVDAYKIEFAETLIGLFDAFEASSRLPEPALPPPSRPHIFIGHGGKRPLWKNLRDHLQTNFGFEIEAYESGSRVGEAIPDILTEMLRVSNYAILVMTGEDEMKDGWMRARQNVVHEIGLFQARLGTSKTVLLVEEGTQLFTNIDGIQHIRFPRDMIENAFGQVDGAIRKAFPQA